MQTVTNEELWRVELQPISTDSFRAKYKNPKKYSPRGVRFKDSQRRKKIEREIELIMVKERNWSII